MPDSPTPPVDQDETPAVLPAADSPGIAVVIPAKDEAERIAATVRAAAGIPRLRHLVVVDDGSLDATGRCAVESGAVLLRHAANRGKAAAMQSGADRVATLDDEAGVSPSVLLFVDADLGATAAATAVLAGPVLAGEADMTIAVLPRQLTQGGGRGLVVDLARRGIRQATGWTATQPLSGMRCLTREAFDAARPLAPGWGVETGLSIDLLLAGYRVLEVPCELHHRVTGSDLRSQLHRAGQYRDVARALAGRRLRRAAPLRLLRLRQLLGAQQAPSARRP